MVLGASSARRSWNVHFSDFSLYEKTTFVDHTKLNFCSRLAVCLFVVILFAYQCTASNYE